MAATVLLSRGTDRPLVSISRARMRTRVLARIHAVELDRQLAAGASPDSSEMLSLRAQQLNSVESRRQMAAGFRLRLRAARRAPHPLDRRLPLARAQIRRCADLIEALASRLEALEPADPRGIASGHVLLSDGRSPLYTAHADVELGQALEQALEQLALPPSLLSSD
jgi:hypothetical protein